MFVIVHLGCFELALKVLISIELFLIPNCVCSLVCERISISANVFAMLSHMAWHGSMGNVDSTVASTVHVGEVCMRAR